ncbi:MAG: thioredoxin family protein [Acidobacteriota bacterium]|nr:thioredoxin family protein [Acidobacteriota bacterium]
MKIVRKRRLWLLMVCMVGGCLAAAAQSHVVGDGGPGPVKAAHLTAEMVSLGPAIAPGGTQEVGLVLTMDEHWHVYWRNAGDSGEPPHVEWTLPEGMTAGAMQFPIPSRLPLGPLMDFGYEDEVAFPMTISAAAAMKPGPVHLDAQVTWLVCAQVCLPGKAHLGIDLVVQLGAVGLEQEPKLGKLGEAMTLIPGPLPAGMKFSVRGDAQQFELMLMDGKRETDAEFYPLDKDAADVIVNAAEQKIEAQRDGVRLYVKRSPDLTALPATLHGVLKLSDSVAYDVSAPVVQVANVAAGRAVGAQLGTTAMGAIGLAFLGGVILNLMPCVFPVLFLKGLALLQSSTMERGELRRHGLVYALGILVSFWGIVSLLLLLRATGSHAGWGFQFQSPAFIAVLASFMFLFALSLAGQFELGLSLTSVGGELAQKQGYAGSFFTGVLATVVATPCMGPLLGAAVGFALVQSAGVTFAVFTAVALGLAAPYVLLCWQPAWAKLLPKPGGWMEVLKQLTAVPLFATAIWLAWVYGQLYAGVEGVNQVALLLGCFLLLSVAGWALGRWPARWGSALAAVVLITLALAVPLTEGRKAARAGAVQAAAVQPGFAMNGTEVVWLPYSEEALNAARAAGHPVFIDFTAAWCLSCQVNERVVLKTAEIESALLKGGVVTMKADWTNSDPAITAKLASVGRASVPTYVVYPAAASGMADVLPELLTKELVLKAIERNSK